MSLYKDASLVMIPSAVKDGKLYSIRPTDGSGDFTFSRGSNLAATRVDVNGLIEKGRENLLLQSNSFSSSSWIQTDITPTSGQVGYDGTNDAWELNATAANGNLVQALSFSGVNTLSFYAKQGSLQYVFILFNGGGFNGTASIDLADGAIYNTSAFIVDIKTTNVGGGWYRIEAVSNRTNSDIRIYPSNNNSGGTTAVGNIYIQDAQLEKSMVATDYIETGASTAQAGILEDLPRLDYSGGASCPSLLLEPQRSNIVTQSDANANWNMVANVTNAITQDVLSPEGVYNAWSATRNINSGGYTYMVNLGVSPSTTYTASIWLKAADLSVCNEINFNFHANSFAAKSIKLSFVDGSVTGDGVVESYPNGWYRVSLTSTSNASIGYFDVGLQPLLNGSTSWGGSAGDVLWYAYGTQVEAGSYPTSYIPTMGSAVTRSYDSCNLLDLVSKDIITDSTEWTIMFDVKGHSEDFDSGDSQFYAGQNSTIDLYMRSNHTSGKFARFYWRKDSKYIGSAFGKKVIARLSGGIGTTFADGVLNGSSSINGNYDLIGFAKSANTSTSGFINQILIFPTALTDSECIALTTL